ncbi:hypothetical protein SZ64_10105 [Erythrobacter sp. SG61-1L]|uniref:DUF6607 family protein n=1 Tax=Erythrobacter sp. SG61-1L TaxID=1603897 RepID=UPI0006C9009B|nr:DUF6607 family protein [Erythrobacter sp. SG61-1L]KPL68436.1 hypothetical protein SZ64_10105 [Erythrobacter sp. SG61-1L]
MKPIKKLLGAGLAALALAAGTPALAHGPLPEGTPAEERAAYEADRADILAMAGDFRVRFDMQESTRWRSDYEPIPAKVSGGYESVRVIEDSGTRIVLQHLLVVDIEGKSHVIKHWRQDWEYAPEKILAYSGPDSWSWEEVPEKMRHGRWSQTVWQVDDSPRYSGWGQFETQGGVRRWRSSWTWRPLARRDAVRHPVYDRYLAINRHQLTPDGWIHWQDNTKMGLIGGKLEPVVQEYVLNTYTRFNGYDVKAADDYWAATKGYWTAVRGIWDEIAEKKGGIHVKEEAETGTVISGRLLELADEVLNGQTKESAAIAEARKLIDGNTGGK